MRIGVKELSIVHAPEIFSQSISEHTVKGDTLSPSQIRAYVLGLAQNPADIETQEGNSSAVTVREGEINMRMLGGIHTMELFSTAEEGQQPKRVAYIYETGQVYSLQDEWLGSIPTLQKNGDPTQIRLGEQLTIVTRNGKQEQLPISPSQAVIRPISQGRRAS